MKPCMFKDQVGSKAVLCTRGGRAFRQPSGHLTSAVAPREVGRESRLSSGKVLQ